MSELKELFSRLKGLRGVKSTLGLRAAHLDGDARGSRFLNTEIEMRVEAE